jgi:hypothetical protein
MKDNKLKFGLNFKKLEMKILKHESSDDEDQEEVDYKNEINKNIKKQQEYNSLKVIDHNISSLMK